MSVDLSSYTASLRRQVNPPNGPAIELPDYELTGYLADAFWQAKLEGFMKDHTAVGGVVYPIDPNGTDVALEYMFLVVLYAAYTLIRNQLIITNTAFRAQAGPVKYEVEHAASLLTEMAKQLKDLLDDTRDLMHQQEVSMSMGQVSMIDGLTVRANSYGSYAGWFASEAYGWATPVPSLP